MPSAVTPLPDASTNPTTPLVVALENVTVRINGVTVLRHVGLRLAEGERVILTGPNGSGKSTLLRVLAGLHRVSEGRIERGTSLTGDTEPGRRALVGHDVSLSPSLTVRENLELIATMLGRQQESVSRALIGVGLAGAADRPIAACSQGMARRAELARIVLTAPQLLLLDEAHAALDASARHLAVEIASSVTQRAGCAVLVAHDVAAFGRWPTRVLRVGDGRVEDAT